MPISRIQIEIHGKLVDLSLPEKTNDQRSSVFVVGLPKAGSTLLNRIMAPLCNHVGLTKVSINNQLRSLGIPLNKLPASVTNLYDPTGYAYMGYRGLSRFLPLPKFASGRTVLLVRDPRDMVVSAYFSEAFSHRPPGAVVDDGMSRDFESRRQMIISTPIDEYVLSAAANFNQIFLHTRTQLAGIDHRFWRYEDIIFEKKRWTEEMLDYLGLEIPRAISDRTVQRNDVVPSSEKEAEHIRRVTPGDYMNKLMPETIAQLNEQFADILATYDYS
jgi:hypothetical protein